MASLTPSVSLLSGPTISLRHAASPSQRFHVISQAIPLCMFAYFSSFVRDGLPRPLDCTCNTQEQLPGCPLHGDTSRQQDWELAAVEIVGGDRRTYLDLIRWMEQCCHQGANVPMSTVLTEVTQQARALVCIDILRIEALQYEEPNLIRRLIQVDSIRPKEGRDLYLAGEDIPQVILDAMCHKIATRFANGFLGICTLIKWYEVADRHRRFDEGVKHCLNLLQSWNLNSQWNENFVMARRDWAERDVTRYRRDFERRSSEGIRRHSGVVPDPLASHRERYSRAVGEVNIQAHQQPSPPYSRRRQSFERVRHPRQESHVPPASFPSTQNASHPLGSQYVPHQPQPPTPDVPPNGAATPLPAQTAHVHHAVHHSHHLPRSRTHRDRSINTDSRYQHRRSSSYSRREHDNRGWRQLNMLTGEFERVDDWFDDVLCAAMSREGRR